MKISMPDGKIAVITRIAEGRVIPASYHIRIAKFSSAFDDKTGRFSVSQIGDFIDSSVQFTVPPCRRGDFWGYIVEACQPDVHCWTP